MVDQLCRRRDVRVGVLVRVLMVRGVLQPPPHMVSTFLRNAASTGSEVTDEPVVDVLGERGGHGELAGGVERDVGDAVPPVPVVHPATTRTRPTAPVTQNRPGAEESRVAVIGVLLRWWEGRAPAHRTDVVVAL